MYFVGNPSMDGGAKSPFKYLLKMLLSLENIPLYGNRKVFINRYQSDPPG